MGNAVVNQFDTMPPASSELDAHGSRKAEDVVGEEN